MVVAQEKIRRYAWQRTQRPRNWHPRMFTDAPSASHSAPRTGGFRSVRAYIHEIRAREAATLPGNFDEERDCG